MSEENEIDWQALAEERLKRIHELTREIMTLKHGRPDRGGRKHNRRHLQHRTR